MSGVVKIVPTVKESTFNGERKQGMFEKIRDIIGDYTVYILRSVMKKNPSSSR